MSEEQSEIKKKEIEELEKTEKRILEDMDADACPYCNRLTKTFEYLTLLPSPFGWLECPGCGMIFCPASIRRQKLSHFPKPKDSVLV